LHRQSWLADREDKSATIRRLFERIAPNYDRLNQVMSLSRHQKWRDIAISKLNLKTNDSALDLCTGTGDFLKPLRKAVGPNGTLLGLDFCEPMLRVGQEKNGTENFGIADAMDIPIKTESVDGVAVGWGIRNVSDIDLAHREIFRILKPNGRFVSIDMAQPKNSVIRAISRISLAFTLPKLGKLCGQTEAYTYLQQSTLQFWSREKLADSMREAGFTDVHWQNLTLGNICIHWGEKPGKMEGNNDNR